MGVAATTTWAAAGAGLIITLMTSSETLAALSSLRASMLVSNWSVPPAAAERILAMMISSERPRPTMSMTSLLVILLPSCWLHVAGRIKRNKAASKKVRRFMGPPDKLQVVARSLLWGGLEI